MPRLPSLPPSFSRTALTTYGFVGWQTWDDLRATGFTGVPAAPSTYVVYRTTQKKPSFLQKSPAGHHKGEDPTVPIAVLCANWVPKANVMYIGKANSASERLATFASFGAGRKAGHKGGRYIWQLADSGKLLVAWRAIDWDETARDYEKRLIALFRKQHDGARPFANLND